MPASIQHLLQSRLERLPPLELAVGQRASVEGQVFHSGSVWYLSPEALRGHISNGLSSLLGKDLIQEESAHFVGQHAFRFRHLLIRDAAYESMLKATRVELHEKFADWLTLQAGDRLAEYEEIVGYHLEQAHRCRVELGHPGTSIESLAHRGGEALLSAGRRAWLREDFRASVALLERATELLPSTNSEWLLARYELADALYEAGDFDASFRVAGKVRGQAFEAGNRRVHALADGLGAYLSYALNPDFTVRRALERTRAAYERVRDAGDDRGTLRMARHVQLLTFTLGQADEALSDSLACIADAARLGARADLDVSLRQAVGWAHHGSTPVPKILDLVDELAIQADTPWLRASVYVNAVPALAMLGRLNEARETATWVWSTLEEAGLPLRLMVAHSRFAEMERLAGDTSAAERRYREAFRILQEINETQYLSLIAVELGDVMYQLGRYDDAFEYATICRNAAAVDNFVPQGGWRALTSKLMAREGQLGRAVKLAQEAVATGEHSDYLNWRATWHADLAEVLRMAGRGSEAADALRRSLELFTRKGNLVMAARVQGELQEMVPMR